MASDRIFGLITLITAVAYIAAATQIQTNLFSGQFLPKLFPFLIGGIAALSSLVLIFKPDPNPQWPQSPTWINMAIAVAVLSVYAVMITPLGFILPTMFAAGIISYQISPNVKNAALSGLGLALVLFILASALSSLALTMFCLLLALVLLSLTMVLFILGPGPF